jgi:hypothetical protein
MPNVNFYLKKPEGTPAKSLIYLQFNYSGKKLIYSFGQNIDAAKNKKGEFLLWNKNTKRVKDLKQTTQDGKFLLNDLLDNLEKVCTKSYNSELAGGIPAPEILKSHLDAFMNQNEEKPEELKIYELFDRFISGEIKFRGKDKSYNTLKNYKTTKGHLKAFDKATKYHVSFENINLDFFYKYTSFLKSHFDLKINTIKKDITILKTVLNEAVDL